MWILFIYSFISTCAHTHAEKKNKPKKSAYSSGSIHTLWLLHRRPKRHSHILKWISVWAGRAPDNCIMFGDEEKTWQRAVLKKPMSFPLAFLPSWSFKAAGIFGSLVYSVLGAVSPWVTPYLDWYSTRSKCTFTCHFVTAHPDTYWMMERLFCYPHGCKQGWQTLGSWAPPRTKRIWPIIKITFLIASFLLYKEGAFIYIGSLSLNSSLKVTCWSPWHDLRANVQHNASFQRLPAMCILCRAA